MLHVTCGKNEKINFGGAAVTSPMMGQTGAPGQATRSGAGRDVTGAAELERPPQGAESACS